MKIVNPAITTDLSSLPDRLKRGLVDVSPASRRRQIPPAVMAVPPTFTNGTGAGGSVPATQITGATRILPSDARFRYYAGAVSAAGASGADSLFVRSTHVSGGSEGPTFWVDFDVDCQTFEFLWKANTGGTRYRMYVDGVPANTNSITTASDGLYYGTLVDFGTKAARRVSFCLGSTFFWGGIYLHPVNGTLWASSELLGPRFAWVGDSFGEGTGAAAGTKDYAGMAVRVAELLGIWDCLNDASGGTGYLNPNVASSRRTYGERLQADVLARTPGIILFQGGYNDQLYAGDAYNGGHPAWTTGVMYAAALDCYTRAKASGAIVIVVTPMTVTGQPQGGILQTRDQIYQAALDAGVHLIIDVMGGTIPYTGNVNNYVGTGWLTGTGHVGGTNATGNADFYVSADSVHPTDAGHEMYARRIAAAISAALPL